MLPDGREILLSNANKWINYINKHSNIVATQKYKVLHVINKWEWHLFVNCRSNTQ